MTAFKLLLTAMILAVGIYTVGVIMEHGFILFSVFFGDMAAMNWAGQFNTDFICFLMLSALWLAWRHHFTPGGLVLGIFGFFGGIMVLAPYLLWAMSKSGGDMKEVMLGPKRAHS